MKAGVPRFLIAGSLGNATAPRSSYAIRNFLTSSIKHSEQRNVDHSTSSKLWEDALREEAEEESNAVKSQQKSTPSLLAAQNQNWDGEESIQDAVLRMLVDKYKPLRGPAVRSADEKLKQAPPNVAASTSGHSSNQDAHYNTPQYRADEPLLPSIEGHKPWLVTFKPPSHSVNVKLGNIASHQSSIKTRKTPSGGVELESKIEPSTKRRIEQAERLGRARESMLDYRMGIKNGMKQHSEGLQKRPAPVGLKGWASLVEERIERARQEGHFKNIRGRGRPIIRENEERNPFIAREEFLMNRILKRNEAAPPWVELQTELEAAVTSFRAVLRQSWTRRAIRMLTLRRHHSRLASLTLSDACMLRDSEWEARERSYHDTALEEVNTLVRRYNGVAPYPVRRTYHDRQTELERAYKESGEDILRGVQERLKAGRLEEGGFGDYGDGDDGGGKGMTGNSSDSWQGRLVIWDVIRRLFTRLRA